MADKEGERSKDLKTKYNIITQGQENDQGLQVSMVDTQLVSILGENSGWAGITHE